MERRLTGYGVRVRSDWNGEDLEVKPVTSQGLGLLSGSIHTQVQCFQVPSKKKSKDGSDKRPEAESNVETDTRLGNVSIF